MPIRSPLPTRRHMLAMTGAAILTAPALHAGAPAVATMTGRAFGTDWRVTLPADRDPEGLRTGLEGLLAEIDRMMSPWRADSEICGFNRADVSQPVSAETVHVAQAALMLAATSDGWFDPSVGPLVHRWGFGPIEGEAGGWRGLRAEGDLLAKDQPGLTLDLCGIAKGRALDLMADRLAEAGHKHFLIDLGGELAAGGAHPSGRPWQVAVENPSAPGAAAVVALSDLRVATSGTGVQGYDLRDHHYSHIIDPRRDAPVEGPLASVSVLSHSAMLADGWATALTAAGPEGPALARRHSLDALFLFRDTTGLRAETTGNFARHML